MRALAITVLCVLLGAFLGLFIYLVLDQSDLDDSEDDEWNEP